MGLIYEERRDYEKAASFYFLSAQLTKNDGDLWLKIAYMYKDLANYKDAIYCLNRAAMNDK